MSLKILCAGCGADEREQAESDVRRALGTRLEGAAWTVSLVKMQRRWSVTLTRPAAATITCVAPEGRLAEAIVEALGGGGPAPEAPAPSAPAPAAARAPGPAVSAARAPAAAPAVRTGPPAAARPAPPAARPSAPSAPGMRATRHECSSCQQAFLVRYEAHADESEETVPVACPHCWHRNYVLVAESAAETREYTAEKA